MYLVTTVLPRISYLLTFILIYLVSKIDFNKYNINFEGRTILYFVPFLNSLFLLLGS